MRRKEKRRADWEEDMKGTQDRKGEEKRAKKDEEEENRGEKILNRRERIRNTCI